MTKPKTKTLETIADLKAAPYNEKVRKIDKASSAGLGKSLDAFGDISGITWNQRTGHLVCGHQRVAELRKRDAKFQHDPLALVVGSELFPVRVVDWSPEKEMQANVQANNQRIAGDWLAEGLAETTARIRNSLSTLDYEELRYDDLLRDVVKSRRDLAERSAEPQLQNLTYSVIIDFDNEKAQGELLEELEKRGLSCRLLMS